jgi:CheY-like chemotaxis protein
VKFVERGGVLVLAQKSDAGAIRFTVSDTGPGVPQGERAHIFEAFAQGESGLGGRHVGAGLGLAIAKRLADGMGGRLGVGGVEGSGADFWFEAELPEVDAQIAGSPLAGRTVAVVSPSAIVREAAARQIEASGGRAVRAESQEQALPLTGDKDVVLVDHVNGSDPVQAPEGRASVILLRPEERGLIAPYRAAGFGGYLIKPLRRASLVERVTLAGKASASDDDRIARRVRHAPSAGGVKVLLAEDNPINAMLARTLLRREGAEVEHVEDGERALLALVAGGYDLVLMDVRMPGVGGLEATRSLRARGVNTPVVALTANAFEDDRRACLEAGMDDFLVKPLSPEALRAALARWTGHGWTGERTRVKVAS